MCGIVGFIDFENDTDKKVLFNMISMLRHRGPDDQGEEYYQHSHYLVGLGQTRLSILDLSPAGYQPMHYEHLSIVFNGEIYNFREIKDELTRLTHQFKSESDTEVILHAYTQWGVHCVEHFIGMFAFAIYDEQQEQVVFFRDRAGVKPLYYYWNEGLFLFGSELKALLLHPRFIKEIDLDSLSLYFKYGYIPAPFSIFKNTFKLEPGHWMSIQLKKRKLTIEKYWDVLDYYKKPLLVISYEDAKSELEKLLISAFNYRMVADVPVGVFLSGGYDSTAVAAILQKERTEKINTFTIGFDEWNNEAPFAKETANYLGTSHSEYYCTSAEAKEIIPLLPYFFDEPFADSSAIPTILVSRIARKQVTVALSADAGDEVFGGYNSYRSLNRNSKILHAIPNALDCPLSLALSIGAKLTPDNALFMKHKLQTLSEVLKAPSQERISILFDSMQGSSSNVMKEILLYYNPYAYSNIVNRQSVHDNISIGMAMDYRNYLQNDILTKVDRATMSVSLEGREPLLDHRIIEFAARLPMSYKFDGNTTKRILKEIVHQYIPKKMMDRPKSGFSLPISDWLRGDLSYLLDNYLNKDAIAETGLFNTTYIDYLLKLFIARKLHDESIIWKILQFQMWYFKWL